MDLPDPATLIDEFDAHIDDADLNIGAAVEQAFENEDGPTQYYARRTLDEEATRHGAANADDLAGVGLDSATTKEVDEWVGAYVAEWRRRFGDVEERPLT